MIVKQYYLGCLSHASYLIGDEATGNAVVVDPQRDVDQYVRDAESLGLSIKNVMLTHFHADFVAGHLELSRRTGAPISLGVRANPQYAFQPLREGDEVEHGNVQLKVLETPGHTPEAISLVVCENDRPKAVLTGDTLFVGDVGRPDLMVNQGGRPEEMASQLYDSLHGKLLQLPDETVVYPAHGPGSLCGSGQTDGTVSTIGQERRENPMLIPGKAAFVEAITRDLPEVPSYFARDAELNQIQRPLLEDVLPRENRPLTLEELRGIAEVQVLDVRSQSEFLQGHLRGSVNIGLDGRFAQWAGALLDPARPIAVIAPPGREEEALMWLGRVGFDHVSGYLQGGIASVPPEDTARPSTATVHEVHARLQSPEPPVVVDVRSGEEFRGGHIQGAVNLPLTQLPQRWQEIPADRPVVVHCQSGYRSNMAASLLASHGVACHTDMIGGIAAWQQAGFPVSTA